MKMKPSTPPSDQPDLIDIGTKLETHEVVAPNLSRPLIANASSSPTIRNTSLTLDELTSMDMNVNKECVNLSRFYLDHEEDYIRRVAPDYPQTVQKLPEESIRLIFNNLILCANKLNMTETAIYLTIDIVHRILTKVNIGTGSPYLLAAALFVAQKVEPGHTNACPSSKFLAKLFGENNTHFTSFDLYGNEIILLEFLNFHVETITSYHYVKFFSNVAGYRMEQESLLHYLTQICAMNPESYAYRPSALTAAGVLIVNEVFGMPRWTEKLHFFTTYSPEMLVAERCFILTAWKHVVKLVLEGCPPAVYVKFSSPSFGGVSSLLLPDI